MNTVQAKFICYIFLLTQYVIPSDGKYYSHQFHSIW